jgi:hypothetical protein
VLAENYGRRLEPRAASAALTLPAGSPGLDAPVQIGTRATTEAPTVDLLGQAAAPIVSAPTPAERPALVTTSPSAAPHLLSALQALPAARPTVATRIGEGPQQVAEPPAELLNNILSRPTHRTD